MFTEDRIWNFVERYFKSSKDTAWPTVRQVAKGTKLPMIDVKKAVEETNRLDFQGYNVEKLDWKELEVYTTY